MPVLKYLNEGYTNADAVSRLVFYIASSAHAMGSNTTSTCPKEIVWQMQQVKRAFHKEEGRQIRHFILVFGVDDPLDPEDIWRLAPMVAAYYEPRYQIFWGLHCGEGLWHLHFAFNSVSYVDGLMYSEGVEDFSRLSAHIQALLPGLQLVRQYEPSGKRGS